MSRVSREVVDQRVAAAVGYAEAWVDDDCCFDATCAAGNFFDQLRQSTVACTIVQVLTV